MLLYCSNERQRIEARAARGDLEAALDVAGWPYSRHLSLWLDALLVIGETT